MTTSTLFHRASATAIALLCFCGCKRDDEANVRQTGREISQSAERIAKKADEKAGELADAAVAKANDIKNGTTANAPSTSAPTAKGGGPTEPRDTARDEIARARCQHLLSCGAVAHDKTYEDLSSCVQGESDKVGSDLLTCGPIAQSRLGACRQAMRSKKCDAFFPQWPDACTKTALCK